MFVKRLIAVAAAVCALATVGIGFTSATAAAETGRWCAPAWSRHWWVCLVQETDLGGGQWYHAHGWNDLNQYIIVQLTDRDDNLLDVKDGTGWAATNRYREGRIACIYDPIHNSRITCSVPPWV
jgi:hypothetical protein